MPRKPAQPSAKHGPVPNQYHVPTRKWDAWLPAAQSMFNEVYGQVVGNQTLLASPSMHAMPPRAWQVLCWNMTWIAVDEADKRLRVR